MSQGISRQGWLINIVKAEANTKYNGDLMLEHRLQRWPNIIKTFVFQSDVI